MLFLWIVLIAAAGLSVLNSALSQSLLGVLPYSAARCVSYALFAVAFSFAMDALIAAFVRHALPSKWFDHKKSVFTVEKKEKLFYEKIKIRKWKDKIPEWGK